MTEVGGGMDDERVTVAELIRRRRAALGVTDQQAGADLGVKQGTFNRWKNGEDVPTDDRLPELAAWLGLPEDTVALAMVHGRRNRPPADRASAWVEVLERLESIDSRLTQVERRADPGADEQGR